MGDILLDVKGLKKYFPIQRGFLRRTVGYVKAVDDVSLYVRSGETLGLVGESGCGKTTASRCIIRLYEPTAGQVFFKTRALSPDGTPKMVNLLELSREEMNRVRQEIAMIFQDPINSLNPRMTVADIIAEPMVIHGKYVKGESEERIVELLRRVGLRPDHLRRYPHEFSGGQRQRIGIARALALNPRFIVCDEPVSALDVSIQSQILNLLKDLQREYGFSYLFVAHDLSVVEHISDRVGVMYLGKLVEMASRQQLFSEPLHPYTKALMSAIPIPDPRRKRERIVLRGEVPSPLNPPSGCRFHPRCPIAEEVCKQVEPVFEEKRPGHWVACHLVAASGRNTPAM
ncbi:MAG: ATP-binding cassette domain-containing protein [Thermoflexales bacterium]|nr:ATP-binding cassette domain-containing protein [Thermoflexales bacterium]